jgi:hypothetical protein
MKKLSLAALALLAVAFTAQAASAYQSCTTNCYGSGAYRTCTRSCF